MKEEITIRIMINDGIIEGVLAKEGSPEINVEIIDFDSNSGKTELYEKKFDENDMEEIDFSIDHCIDEDDDEE